MNGYRMILNAFRTCIVKYNLDMDENNFCTTNYSEEEAYDIIIQKFSNGSIKPDALIAHDGVLCAGAFSALQSLGLNVPEDTLVVQGTSMFVNSDLKKRVSYIERDGKELCQKAVSMLVQLIQGQQVTEKQVYVYPKLKETVIPDEQLVIQNTYGVPDSETKKYGFYPD